MFNVNCLADNLIGIIKKEKYEINTDFLTALQRVNKISDTKNKLKVNSRLDLEFSYDMNLKNSFLIHLRTSKGNGLELGSVSSVNAIVPGEEKDFNRPIILQTIYSQKINEKISMDFGRIDPYVFFDTNGVADDESESFLNLAFIHNPLLDIGGDMNPGTHGGAPGLHFKYANKTISSSLVTRFGILGAGEGADFHGSARNRISLVQFEVIKNENDINLGHYRLYAWKRNDGIDVDNVSKMLKASGWGVSIDKSVNRYTSIFSRFGSSLDNFSQDTIKNTKTIGFVIKDLKWISNYELLGYAYGNIKMESGTNEDIHEIFYKFNLGSEVVSITPSLQVLKLENSENINIFSVRLKVNF